MIRHLANSLEHHDFHRKSKMKGLAEFMILRTLAISLFSVFIPIFLYKSGVHLSSIFLYYFVAYLAEAAFEVFSVILFREIGPKKTILFSVPIFFYFLYLISTFNVQRWPVWFIGAVVGVSLAFFWQPYHYLYSKYKDSAKAGTQVSIRTAVLAIISAFGPLVGGYFITNYQFSNLLYIAIFLMTIGAFCLLGGGEEKVKEKFNVREIKLKKYWRPIVAYMGFTWEECTASVVWPLLVFTLLGTYKSVGLITTFTLLVTIVTTLIVGHFADKGERKNFIIKGSIFNIFIDVIRIISATLYHILIVNVLKSFSESILYSPFVSEYYLLADDEVRDEYIFAMEFFSDVVRVIGFGILMVVAIYFKEKTVFIVAFLMAGFGALLSGLMPQSRRDVKIENQTIKIMPRPAKVR